MYLQFPTCTLHGIVYATMTMPNYANALHASLNQKSLITLLLVTQNLAGLTACDGGGAAPRPGWAVAVGGRCTAVVVTQTKPDSRCHFSETASFCMYANLWLFPAPCYSNVYYYKGCGKYVFRMQTRSTLDRFSTFSVQKQTPPLSLPRTPTDQISYYPK